MALIAPSAFYLLPGFSIHLWNEGLLVPEMVCVCEIKEYTLHQTGVLTVTTAELISAVRRYAWC